MNLSDRQMMEIAQHAFTRMDGAWFMALAKKFGTKTAWEMDAEAWKQFAYVFGKNIRKNYIPDPVWPESFLDMMDIFCRVLKIEGRKITLNGDQIIIRITDCEIQKAIAKAGVADCGIVTVHSYQGMINGLFAKEIKVHLAHTKNLNHGDDCCEVIITPG
ncbi:MAG: L-2-amino-thiazoline-4-carboxylic acid hydrolase [Deltaproteobacteria bacterium]